MTELYGAFFRIGLFTFGGGYAILPMIQKEIVERKKWVSDRDVVDYYAVIDDSKYLCKIHMDGTGWTRLTWEEFHSANVGYYIEGDWIYYSDGGAIYRMATDGSQDTKIFEEGGHSMNVADGWIYYLHGVGDWETSIRKVRTDGSEPSVICENSGPFFSIVYDLNIVGEWIYFIHRSSDYNSLYRVRTDGTELEVVSDGYSETIAPEANAL